MKYLHLAIALTALAVGANPAFADEVSVTTADLSAVPLYPGAYYIDKKASKQSLGTDRGTVRYVKFLTQDDVSRVYEFYVGALKRNGYQFLKGATKEGFKARSDRFKTIVSVKYFPLQGGKKGSVVGVAEFKGERGAPNDLGFGVSKWVTPSILKRWSGS